MLVDLGASLIDHAATLTDQDAAAKERFRARDLVQKAWELGNTNPLAENLRQLLRDLPANGAIKLSDNPAIEGVMNTAEAAFARHDFDEALTAFLARDSRVGADQQHGVQLGLSADPSGPEGWFHSGFGAARPTLVRMAGLSLDDRGLARR